MFFCRSDPQSCQELKKIIQKYETASGQKINKEKSVITISSKTNNETRTSVKTALEIQKEGGLGKYLGLPEHFGRKKKDLFSMIVDRIRQKAHSWSSSLLSQAGRLTMLKSVLATMPTYTMTCFKLPASLYKRIQSALTCFWWDGNQENKKMSWISWKKMIKSKRDGGLGFRDLQHFNDALLAKLPGVWNTNDSLPRLERNLYRKRPSETSSWEDHWRWEIDKYWTEPWLSLDEQCSPMGPAPQHTKEFQVADLISPTTGTWDQEKIKAIVPHHEKQILELRPIKLGGKDKLVWLHTEEGIYTTKFGYYERIKQEEEKSLEGNNLDMEGEQPRQLNGFKWNEEIWKMPTLQRGGNDAPSTVHCAFAQEVWRLVPCAQTLDVQGIQTLRMGVEETRKLICLPPTGVGSGPISAWVLWALWKSRNQKIFNGNERQFTPEETTTQAISNAREWQSAQLGIENKHTGTRRKDQRPIRMHAVRCNSDAAWRKETKTAGMGWCFSNDRGEPLGHGSTTRSVVRSPLMAEALALLGALHQARNDGHNHITVASDSQKLIGAINRGDPSKELHGILHDILEFSQSFIAIFFSFVSRDENVLANRLAKNVLADLNQRPV
ncbi:unnamed protein product [Microthlaspi erraticum]|uniref:RNase H type-1 domain-containing protein n=1 Tax=Microthlaspi erraticum TaxID=1685480 RepID=A0A6D2IQQ9_9BRAS|nr:unnamed protein product [Microthlaspi erraticum]